MFLNTHEHASRPAQPKIYRLRKLDPTGHDLADPWTLQIDGDVIDLLAGYTGGDEGEIGGKAIGKSLVNDTP